MKRSIKISPEFFNELLKRITMHEIIDAIAQQNNVFEHGEKFVLLGSALASYESKLHLEATPIHRAPSDIDFYLYEPKGEQGRFGIRMSNNDRVSKKQEQSDKMGRVLQNAVRSIGAIFRENYYDDDGMAHFESEMLGNRSYDVTKSWTKEEIRERLSDPSVNVTIQKILGNRMDNFEIINIDELLEQYQANSLKKIPGKVDCHVNVQLVSYPMSFLKPLPLSTTAQGAQQASLVMADDTLNTLALKLVRLVLPDNSRQLDSNMMRASGAAGRVRNMLDIHDIMNLRRVKKLPPIDLKCKTLDLI